MATENTIDKKFVYKILKEGLFDQHKVDVTDPSLFAVLDAGANWDKWALIYLENSTEIQQLLEALKWVNDSYTTKNFDAIRSYLKNNPEYNDTFYITFDDFYVETFSDMLSHLTNNLLDLQNIDEIIHFTKCISKGMPELKKIGFPDGHNELTFVIKTSFDTEDGALVHQVFMWKTEDIAEDEENDHYENDNEDDESEGKGNYLDDADEFDPNQEPCPIDQFISIWAKRTYDKNIILVILKILSYGDDLFSMFELNEKQVKWSI